jgi:group I intron endonuclease
MVIYIALLKYGYSNFSLEILEYCEASEAVSREQHYLDSLNPDYNVLKIAGSRFGHKLSPDTIAKLKAYILTSEQRAKHLKHLRIFNSSEEQKECLKIHNASTEQQEHLKRLKLHNSKKIEVLDTLNNVKTVYSSMGEAAVGIGCAPRTILYKLKNLKEQGVSKLIKNRFQVKPIDD